MPEEPKLEKPESAEKAVRKEVLDSGFENAFA
jgi:hypothetical protein